jgi:DNA-binding transcriptional regulator of glucitol operon
MFGSSAIVLFILLGLMWLLQLYLTYRQTQRFYGRVRKLRKLGMLAVGVAGGMYRGRVYAVMVVNPETRIITHAEKMSGWTVFAGLKQIKGGTGHLLDDFLDGKVHIAVGQKALEALKNAGNDIRRALDQQAAAEHGSAEASA